MQKNNNKSKSGRKPLMDISNGGKSLKPPGKKKVSEEEEENNIFDRLLLTHSDLSNLIHQIDELVVQALKVEVTSKRGRKNIECFTNVLSDMQSSLKSWVPRFRKSLSSPSMESETQLAQSLPSKIVGTSNEEISNDADSPVQFSLVSPSPLVSWCADHTVENGRQLFLLTPLPKPKELPSKCRSLSRSVFERRMDAPPNTTFRNMDAPNTTFGLPSLLTISGNTSDDLLEGVEIKSTLNNFSDSSIPETKSTFENGFVSPPKINRDHHSIYLSKSTFENGFVSPPKINRDHHSIYLMTPRLKMSPPKSCVLLEPISESFHQDYSDIHIPKSTLFHTGTQNCSSSHSSEPSSSYVSENLALKYPELFGLQQTCKSRIERKEIESSLDCYISPPKSCVLMEPPDDKLLINLTTNADLSRIGFVDNDQSTSLITTRDKDIQGPVQTSKKNCNQELVSTHLAPFESTPMWKECESMIRTGKHPGENTLKRELWTRFDAASSNVLRFDISAFQKTGCKGFLDRLEEASCEEMTSIPDSLR